MSENVPKEYRALSTVQCLQDKQPEIIRDHKGLVSIREEIDQNSKQLQILKKTKEKNISSKPIHLLPTNSLIFKTLTTRHSLLYTSRCAGPSVQNSLRTLRSAFEQIWPNRKYVKAVAAADTPPPESIMHTSDPVCGHVPRREPLAAPLQCNIFMTKVSA
ncbi:hypothetical protein EVAR_56640_1 [Eumeta japonica]|uniref:Uncharacterized protein n=1 Tax=Eumeta variegata TaxID=151549 RepID=A0A4C1XLT7_EUMVA|nr:hypothetical protein EVAR_56640_1 [Eumeta japonica]